LNNQAGSLEEQNFDDVGIEAVGSWLREHGFPEYGYDKEGEFTGWIRNPDTGAAFHIVTGQQVQTEIS